MTAKQKERIKKEYIEKFKEEYKPIITGRSKKVMDMIDRLSLMAVLIDECEDHLYNEGLVVQMSQGSYTIDRENPYAKILDRSAKTYQSLIHQLDEMMPSNNKQNAIIAGERFAAAVAKGKKKVDLSEFS